MIQMGFTAFCDGIGCSHRIEGSPPEDVLQFLQTMKDRGWVRKVDSKTGCTEDFCSICAKDLR